MSPEVHFKSASLIPALFVALISITFVLLCHFFGGQVIEAAYHGHSIWPLNQLLAHHLSQHPGSLEVEDFYTIARIGTAMLAIIGAIAFILTVRPAWRSKLTQICRGYFRQQDSPFNLALFRIAVFTVVLVATFRKEYEILLFASMPVELQIPPAGWSVILSWLPINESIAGVVLWLLRVVCVMGIVGWFSRTAALFATILALYVFGIPHFYGKVSHGVNHLVWFLFMLTVCRSSDALGLDAIFAARKRAVQGITLPPARSIIYGLPLRCAWLLIGIAYFFPGFWKLARDGSGWITGDTLKFILWRKWYELGEWFPHFRIDEFPLLYRSMAFYTILFEMVFIIFILFRRTRIPMVLIAVAFHTGTAMFMSIRFRLLLASYVIFVDWDRLFTWIGQWLFPRDLIVVYDGQCSMCLRTVATFNTLDVFKRITYIPAQNTDELNTRNLAHLDSQALLRDMHVIRGDRIQRGFRGYRVMARRLPVFWPFLPMLYLWPIPSIGDRIYRRIADTRSCVIPTAPSSPPAEPRPRIRPIVLIASFLVVSNVLLGFAAVVDSWPLACFPTFAGKFPVERSAYRMTKIDTNGVEKDIDRATLPPGLTDARWVRLFTRIGATEDDQLRARQFHALWRAVAKNNSDLDQTQIVRIWRDRISIDPERWADNPISSELIYEFDPSEPTRPRVE